MSVKEKDPWFVTRRNQLNVMSKQLVQMKNTLGDMSLLKLKLHHGSDQFRNDLVLMLVSRNSERLKHSFCKLPLWLLNFKTDRIWHFY
jgi:hypothetical protein